MYIYFMPSKSPEVIKKARDKWYRNNKDKQVARQMERRKELIQWLWEYKATLQCAHCGMSFKDAPECCDFHHIKPDDKISQVYQLVLSSKKAMLDEVAKCIPLCANCHRKQHREHYRYYSKGKPILSLDEVDV